MAASIAMNRVRTIGRGVALRHKEPGSLDDSPLSLLLADVIALSRGNSVGSPSVRQPAKHQSVELPALGDLHFRWRQALLGFPFLALFIRKARVESKRAVKRFDCPDVLRPDFIHIPYRQGTELQRRHPRKRDQV